jgi:hypothetical protein
MAERKSPSTGANPHFTDCCLDGEVTLPLFGSLPQFLRQLLLNDSPDGRHFRKELRAYNSAFAFTSIDCTRTDRGAVGPGIQVFQIHGALYHRNGRNAAVIRAAVFPRSSVCYSSPSTA